MNLSGDKPKIRDLKEPTIKMSKSAMTPKGYITILDSDDEIVEKIKKAKTDFTSAVTYDPVERPGVSNLIEIHSSFTGKSIQCICEESSNLDTGQYKYVVSEAVVNKLRPIREEAIRLLGDKGYILSVLNHGRERASVIAEETQRQVKNVIGFS